MIDKFELCFKLLKRAKFFAYQQWSATLGRNELLEEITKFEMDLIKEEQNERN